MKSKPARITTFSIVAWDPEAEEWGVAVASKFLAVGSVVPWARAKAGAVATQSLANVSYGPEGLELMAKGTSASEVAERLTSADEGGNLRQLGVVDARGGAATFTGEDCIDWAGGVAGEGFAIQGNILTGPEVVEAMKKTFVSEEGDLADRLLQALLAGDRSGGDQRGRQSAAILIAREGGSYGGFTDRALDLRVDDHQDPVPELIRLRSLHRLYLQAPDPEKDLIDLDEPTITGIQESLRRVGPYDGGSTGKMDESTEKALQAFMGVENLEMRWVGGEKIDRHVLAFLRDRAGSPKT